MDSSACLSCAGFSDAPKPLQGGAGAYGLDMPAGPPSAGVLALTSPGFSLRWNIEAPLGTPTFVTYSFSNARSSYSNFFDNQSFASWLPDQKVHVRQAFDLWAAASGIVFLEVPDEEIGQIRVSLVDLTGQFNAVGQPLSGYAYRPSLINADNATRIDYDTLGGDIFLNSAFYANTATAFTPGQQGFSILLHEIGHAIGFNHPFDGMPRRDPTLDNGRYTVMSYNRPDDTLALGSLDIEASRLYYGASDRDYLWDATRLVLTQYGTEGNDALMGTELDDRFETFGGDDQIFGGPGNDWIYAGYGNDRLSGGPGDDILDGAWGLDVAVFPGPRERYLLTSTPTGIEVRDTIASGEGVDQLASIERLHFKDGILAFDAEGNAGQVFRLYQAAFGRMPDTPGLSHNIRLADQGVSLDQLAAAFLGSPEFGRIYPNWLSDAVLVDQLYLNVLDRRADAAGLAGWLERLEEGSWTRSEMLVGFSESPENIQRLASMIGEGIWMV